MTASTDTAGAAGAGRYKPYPAYKDSGVEWLGEIPAHWEVRRLKFLLAAPLKYGANEAAELDDPDLPRYVRITDIDESDGLRDATFKSLPVEAAEEYLLREGDLLFARSGATAGKTFLYRRSWGTCAYAGYLIRARLDTSMACPDFVRYFTGSSSYWQWLSAAFIQATIQNVSAEKYASLIIPKPSIPEQRAIAAFLDRETARIDALVAKKERLIALLQEQRTALITRAVTKGLDPTVPMKNSGVEWLGEIPAHWEVAHLKYISLLVVDCPHETPVYSDDGEHFVIRTADVDEGRLDLSTARRVGDLEFRRRIRRLAVDENDIVYSREGERFGFAALVPGGVSPCLGQRMMQFRVRPDWFPKFVMWQLNAKCVYQQASLDTTGATSPHVNVETIRNFWVCGSTFAEQSVIAAFLDRETARIDALAAKVHDAIARLKELRTALISAAVTGKIDVREKAAV